MLMYLWQFPQNILGVLLLQWYRPQRRHILDNGVEIYYSDRIRGCVSLGKYSIVNTGHYRKKIEESLKRDTVRHCAIGHAKQSRMLGWLYLVVIGIPSIIGDLLYGANKKHYTLATEKWADQIGSVERA